MLHKSVEKLGNFDQTGEKLGNIFKPILTPKEVALILGVDKKTVFSLCEKGEIQATSKPYGSKITYEIQPGAVEIFLRTQELFQEVEAEKKQIRDHSGLLEDFQTAMRAGLIPGYPYAYSHATVRDYSFQIQVFFKYHQEISVENFRYVLGQLPTGAEGRRHFYQAIVCFCKFLIGQEALKPSVLEQLQKHHRQKPNRNPKRLVLTDEDVINMIQACNTSMKRAIILLLASTGMRAGECRNLKLEDVDFEKQVITIHQGKWDKDRTVGINTETLQALKIYRDERPNVPCDYFFLNRLNQKIERYGIFQRVKRLGKKVGIIAAPHMFRRYFATSNLLAGRSLKEIQNALGHSTPVMTLLYDRTSKEHVTEAMKSWQIASSLRQSLHPPKSGSTNGSC